MSKVRLVIAIVVPILVIVGIVVAVVSNDQTTLIMSLVTGVLYAFYLKRVLPLLKEAREEKNSTSPLRRK